MLPPLCIVISSKVSNTARFISVLATNEACIGTHCHDNWIWYVEYDRRIGCYGPYRGYLSQVAHDHHHHPQQAPLDGPKTTVAVYPCIFGKPCERERIASYISPPIPARPLSSPSLGLLSLCLLVVIILWWYCVPGWWGVFF